MFLNQNHFPASIIPSSFVISFLLTTYLPISAFVKPRERELQLRLFHERVRTTERAILSKPIDLSIHVSLKAISIDLSKDRAERVES